MTVGLEIMENFSLIKKLNAFEEDNPSPMAEGIKYQQYELDVDGKVQVVNIPLRESDAFEKTITETKEPLTRKTLKRILREHRGVREQ
jgi:hypothetical protein